MEWCVDWSNKISDDQIAMNEYLKPLTAGARLLHVGIGNSSLAIQATDAQLIVGITIIPQEVIHAHALALQNYIPSVFDKHSEDMLEWLDLDFIVDNNPFAFCKDENDLNTILDVYALMLNDEGQIISHVKGIVWNFTKITPAGIELDADGNYTMSSVEKIIGAAGLKINYLKNGVLTIER